MGWEGVGGEVEERRVYVWGGLHQRVGSNQSYNLPDVQEMREQRGTPPYAPPPRTLMRRRCASGVGPPPTGTHSSCRLHGRVA